MSAAVNQFTAAGKSVRRGKLKVPAAVNHTIYRRGQKNACHGVNSSNVTEVRFCSSERTLAIESS